MSAAWGVWGQLSSGCCPHEVGLCLSSPPTPPPPTDPCVLCPQLYELDTDPKRKEFLDDLFSFMQKRGEHLPEGSDG